MPYLRIKICGVTSPADVEIAADAGADAIGINFHPASPRYVDPAKAVELVRTVPADDISGGIRRAADSTGVCRCLGIRIGAVQWYGENRQIGDTFPFALIAAFRVRDRQSLAEINAYLRMCKDFGRMPSAVLVDAYVEGQMGGTGHRLPWDLIADFRPEVPLILAGGLTPDNVAEAIRIVQPDGIDVASGVESSPGRKDAEKVKRFIDATREAASHL